MPVTSTTAIVRHVLCVTLSVGVLVARAQAQTTGASSGSQTRPPRVRSLAGAQAPSQTVDISTMDRRGTIRVDGRVVGEGDFHGRLALGMHVIGITQPGYDPFQRTIVLRASEPYVELVSLTPSVVVRPSVGSGEGMRGFYGGFLLHATFEPGGLKGNICSVQGVTQCSTSAPVGGGLLGTFGYMMDPIGIDALFGVQADAAGVKATADGQTASVVIPRIGGIFAARARLAWQNPAVRLTAAGGVGFAFRSIGLIAEGLDTTTYLAPAITLEGALHLRITKTTALSLGLLFWGENAGHGQQLQVKPLTTTVVVVRSTQAFLLPFIGIEVGP